MEIKSILEQLTYFLDEAKLLQALCDLGKKTKTCEEVENILKVNGAFSAIYNLIDNNNGQVLSAVLSILANCANVNEQWRREILKANTISKLEDLLETSTDVKLICRIIRLVANLCKNAICLEKMQNSSSIIALIIRHGESSDIKCQMSCLRAIRVVCTSKQSAKKVVDNSGFSVLLGYLHSTDQNVIILVLRMICELLKTEVIEVFYHIIEGSVLLRLVDISSHICYKDLAIKVLFLLSLNSGCRVSAAMEGSIDVFVRQIKFPDHSDTFKFAVQGVCLCAREAVSRNRMKFLGVLSELTNILNDNDFMQFHETIVAALVWFLFDDSSLGLLIRANVIPALLKYLDRLTFIEYSRIKNGFVEEISMENVQSHNDNTVSENKERLVSCSPLGVIETEKQHQMGYSSPETSPYNPYSPQYSIPSFSPNMSPSYSPPVSPSRVLYSPGSPDHYGMDIYQNNVGSSTSLPYHFQSADGQLAMIHGTRGPIHDIMLLLSRFSQARDPSTFFLDLPGFNTLSTYLLLAAQPNPKCARVLNRLTLNSHCFDVMIKRRLIPRLFLRLCTGHSLESLTALFGKAREKLNCNPATSPDSVYYDENDVDSNLYLHRTPLKTTYDWGKFLCSNLRSQSESSYGKGVFSHILLTGSMELKEQCIVSMAHVIWSSRMQKRIYIELKALDFLVDMMHRCEELSNETFVLLVEAFCALARMLNLDALFKMAGMPQNTVQKESSSMERPSKYRKLDGQQVVELCVCSGTVFECNKDKLAEGSQVFCRMLSDNYLDCQQPYINIRNVDEEAFEVLLHYINGCEVHIDEYKQCQSSYCDIKRIKGNNVVGEPNKSFSNSFAVNVLICSEMFFLDSLKKNLEEFLTTCINNDNVVEFLFLSMQYHAETLLKDSLVYLLATCDCPIYRNQFFAELLYSSEKLVFIEHVNRILRDALRIQISKKQGSQKYCRRLLSKN